MSLRRRTVLSASLGALALPALAGRADAQSGGPVRIGWLAALTGANSSPGIGFDRGVRFAAAELNAAGGRRFEIVTRDTQGDPTKAVNATVEMISRDGVAGIFGPTNSGEALATTPIMARRGVPDLHPCVVDRLIDPAKYPNAFRLAPSSSQWEAAARHYCIDILKAKKIAVLGDTTGYGTTAVAAAAADVTSHGGEVVYRGLIDANQADVSADLLHARSTGAEAILLWSDSTGLIARLINARARMSWDVPMVGHPAMGAGAVAKLLSKPSNWEKVYQVGYASCSFGADGKLPARSAEFVARFSQHGALSDTLLWWVACGYDAVQLFGKAVHATGSTDHAALVKWFNQLGAYPGVFGDYRFSATEHNCYPTSEIVMSAANSFKDGAFALAPGYG